MTEVMTNRFEPDYTFENFITTPYNEMAFGAAQAIVREIGTRYNPFFFCGEIDSGKTHLLHAIGNAINKERDDINLHYTSGTKFAADVVYAIKKHKVTNFYLEYLKCDFLIIDGFDALLDKDVEQNTVIRLFDEMWKRKKQIVVASRLSSRHFPVIEQYFKTSYDTGLMCDILAPEGLAANRALLWE